MELSARFLSPFPTWRRNTHSDGDVPAKREVPKFVILSRSEPSPDSPNTLPKPPLPPEPESYRQMFLVFTKIRSASLSERQKGRIYLDPSAFLQQPLVIGCIHEIRVRIDPQAVLLVSTPCSLQRVFQIGRAHV